MKTTKLFANKQFKLVLLACLLTMQFICQAPALALTMNPSLARTLEAQRRVLLKKEDGLLRDQDELSREIYLIRSNKNQSDRDAHRLRELCDLLDETNSNIRSTDLEIRDITKRML